MIALCFDFDVELPYSYIVRYAELLSCSKKIALDAVHMANSSLYTLDCVLLEPKVLALNCIVAALKPVKSDNQEIRQSLSEKIFRYEKWSEESVLSLLRACKL